MTTGNRVECSRSDAGFQGVFIDSLGNRQWHTNVLISKNAVIEAVVAFGRATTGKPVTIAYDHHQTRVILGRYGTELVIVDVDRRRTCKACGTRGAGVKWEGAFLCADCAFAGVPKTKTRA